MATDSASESNKIPIRCPHCNSLFRAKPDMMGRSGLCPKCRRPFTITKDILVDRKILNIEPEDETPLAPQPTQPVRSPDPPPAEARLRFSSPTFGYAFGLTTAGWQRSTPAEEAESGADLMVEHPNIGAIKVMIAPWELDFDAVCERAEAAYASEVNDFRLIQKSPATVAGHRAVAIEYEGTPPGVGQRYRFLSHLFVVDQMLFQIMAGTALPFFPYLKREAQFVARTFFFENLPVEPSLAHPAAGRPRSVAKMPAEVAGVFKMGIESVWKGVLAGLIIAIMCVGSGAGSNVVKKGLLLLVLPIVGGAAFAGYRWGAIAGYGSGAIRPPGEITALTLFAWYAFPFLWLYYRITRALGDRLACVAAGVPYMFYALLTKRLNVNKFGFMFLSGVGGISGLLCFIFLLWMMMPAETLHRISQNARPSRPMPTPIVAASPTPFSAATPGLPKPASKATPTATPTPRPLTAPTGALLDFSPNVYGSIHLPDGVELGATVQQVLVYKDRVMVRVHEVSRNASGSWIPWRQVVQSSFLKDDRDNTYLPSVEASLGWEDGSFKPGDGRAGFMAFPVIFPQGVNQATLYFAAVPTNPAQGIIRISFLLRPPRIKGGGR